jgi:hypothetical protein
MVSLELKPDLDMLRLLSNVEMKYVSEEGGEEQERTRVDAAEKGKKTHAQGYAPVGEEEGAGDIPYLTLTRDRKKGAKLTLLATTQALATTPALAEKESMLS